MNRWSDALRPSLALLSTHHVDSLDGFFATRFDLTLDPAPSTARLIALSIARSIGVPSRNASTIRSEVVLVVDRLAFGTVMLRENLPP